MASQTDIRDAIEHSVPTDGPLKSDIKIHDGIADISISVGTMRWSQAMAIANMQPDQVGELVGTQVKAWLINALKNLQDPEGKALPHHRRAIVGIREWLDAHPRRNEWLYGKPKRTKMYDDGKIRVRLLNEFPWIEPHRFEMEEYDFGDRLGISYLSPLTSERIKAQVDAKGRDDDSLFEILLPLAKTVFGPAPAPVHENLAEAEVLPVVVQEDKPVKAKRGRHAKACQCEPCQAKKSYHVAA